MLNSTNLDSNIEISKSLVIFGIFLILFLSLCMNIFCVFCLTPKYKRVLKTRIRNDSKSSLITDSSKDSIFIYS